MSALGRPIVAQNAQQHRDEIRTFMGDIPPEEFERRHKLRSYRNAATAMVSSTQCDTARYLAWEVIEWASPNLYSPAPLESLDKLNLLCSRLMKTAFTAEEVHSMLEASDG